MPRLTHRNPTYRKHKASGQAVVTLGGTDIYLGPHGSRTSRDAFDRVIGEWLAAGRTLPRRDGACMSIAELIDAYRHFAENYYRKPDGSDSGEIKPIRLAMRQLRKLYAKASVSDFGPLALKAVRQAMIDAGWCRTYINQQVGRIKRMVKWGVENEHVPATLYHALQAVVGLKEGRTDAKESEPVEPVPQSLVEAVRPLVSPQVRAMIDLQLLTGMRPGEVVAMRRADLDTSGDVWTYTPPSHKTRHHGHERVVPLGPKAKEVLQPFLTPSLHDHLFVPAEAEAQRRQQAHAARKTPMSCGNRPGTNRKRRPKRSPGDKFDVPAYRRAVTRACEKAFPLPAPLARQRRETRQQWKERLTPEQREALAKWRGDHHWHVHQLRHNYATQVRKLFGAESAQVMLGHRNLSVTELYAQKNADAARRIAAQVG